MKKFFNELLAIAAIVAMTTMSCQNDESFDTGIAPGTIVEAHFQPVIPASATSLSSGSGGINNVDDANYDLRYLLEVWSADGNTCIDRKTVIATAYTASVNFTVQLPTDAYKFVFWADFVTKGSTADLTYKTDNAGGLKDIEWTAAAYALSNDLRDAYYAVKDVDLTSGNVNGTVTLKRPFGKLRVLATDPHAKGVVPAKAKVTYTHDATPSFRSSFNALAGEPNVATIDASGDLESVPELEASLTVGGTPYTNVYVLAFDYFLVPADLTAVSFDIELFDAGNASLGAAKSISSVPVGVNKLTTVIGAFLPASTQGDASFDVIVDDDFDNDDDFTTEIASVALNKTALSLYVNDEETLTATVLPANAANKNVTWSSNAIGIATVDNTGKVTAIATGSATITATSNANGAKTATCVVTVNAVPTPGSINLDGATESVSVELTYTDNATENLTITNGAIHPTTALKTIKSIKINAGSPILIGRKADADINLKINGTSVAFRDADGGGAIPIGTYAELQLINKDNTTKAGSYKQEADIDLMSEPWTPINPFAGTFDGGRHAIANLYVNRGTSGDNGLFGRSNNATIKYVNIVSGSVSGGGFSAGLLGYMTGGLIFACSNNADVNGAGNEAAGITSFTYGTTPTIIACRNSGNITNTASYNGGIVGYVGATTIITACYNTGSVTGKDGNGGIVGGGGDITACYNTGTIATNATGTWNSIGNNGAACYTIDMPSHNNNATVFSDTAWPSAAANAEWGTGDGSGTGTYWKDLGNWNGGSPVYPKLFFEE
ncbi:MAG: Ig-like domain-containing protein [Prevotellaceae bacterium]|jgi:hypothetical protein|nr:Ig-like domain-containing protein [Prevotellaceae bacterium]